MKLINNLTTNLTTNLTYNDIFSNVSKAVASYTSKLQGISFVVIVACVATAGFMFFFGDGASRKAKAWLVSILIGAIFIWGASTFASSAQDITGF